MLESWKIGISPAFTKPKKPWLYTHGQGCSIRSISGVFNSSYWIFWQPEIQQTQLTRLLGDMYLVEIPCNLRRVYKHHPRPGGSWLGIPLVLGISGNAIHPSSISGLVGGLPSLGGWDPKRSPQLKRSSNGACLGWWVLGCHLCLGGVGWLGLNWKGWWM